MKFSEILKKMPNTHNQEGFVLITAMLILVVVTMLGISATNTAYFETIISGSEKQYQEQFFKADGGINAVLAQNSVPASGFQVATPATFTCNNTAAETPFTSFDLDGDATPDVLLYLLEQPTSGTIPEIKVASCASLGNTTAEIIAGIQYALATGGIPGTGDENEYSN